MNFLRNDNDDSVMDVAGNPVGLGFCLLRGGSPIIVVEIGIYGLISDWMNVVSRWKRVCQNQTQMLLGLTMSTPAKPIPNFQCPRLLSRHRYPLCLWQYQERKVPRSAFIQWLTGVGVRQQWLPQPSIGMTEPHKMHWLLEDPFRAKLQSTLLGVLFVTHLFLAFPDFLLLVLIALINIQYFQDHIPNKQLEFETFVSGSVL